MEKPTENTIEFVCYSRGDTICPEHKRKSFHLAAIKDGNFVPLYGNVGLCYATATVSPTTGEITPMGIENPFVFAIKEGGFGILATRVALDGKTDAASNGKYLFFKTADFISYEEIGLKTFDELQALATEKIDLNKKYESGISWVNAGNKFSVSQEIGQRILKKFTLIKNVSVEMPNVVQASSETDLKNVRATAIYSDGSQAAKIVEWDSSKIDWTKKGEYEIEGTIKQIIIKYPALPDKADPDAIYYNGAYYFIATHESDQNIGLFLRKADSLEGLFERGATEYKILNPNKEKNMERLFWAPEFHVIGNDLYILFATSGEGFNPQSHMMKLKKGGDLTKMEDWEEPIRVQNQSGKNLCDNGITLDMTTFKVGNQNYLAWAHRRWSPADSGSMIMIATIDENKPWQITSEPVVISMPLFSWENDEKTPVDEGPFALIKNDKIFLSFAGSSTKDDYCEGTLWAYLNSDLLNPASWKKVNYPLLSSELVEGEYGPGHSSFTTDADGTEWYLYHARDVPVTKGWTGRDTGIRTLHYDFEGDPVLYLTADREIKPEFRKVKTIVNVR